MQQAIIRREADSQCLGAPDSSAANSSSSLHPVIARVLQLRNTTPEKLQARLPDLLPPDQLTGSIEAAVLLADMIEQEKNITIVGDYDVDGATGTAVALDGLSALGAAAGTLNYRVPDRFTDGYGLSAGMAEKLLSESKLPALVVTVDNGIASVDGVKMLCEAGVEVIVTDHHLPGEALPDASAIVNPNQPGCAFASKALCGVGVMFYVLLQTRRELERRGWFSEREKPALVELLDLVALGTVADVVPLDDNNRILVSQGIARVRAGQSRPGIRALLRVAKCTPEKLVTRDLSFGVAPRLNASGRLTHIETGIECLLARDETTAQRLAQELDIINNERKNIEKTMQAEAVQQVSQMALDEIGDVAALALYQPDWHEGVVGLIASRIKDKTGRSVAVFAPGAENEAMLKGSLRSIPGVHIRDVLADIDAREPGMIARFGGHAMAAGLSLPKANFEAFSDAFNAAVLRAVDGELPGQEIFSDGELGYEDFVLPLAESLRAVAPWGQAFPAPTFDNCFRVLNQRVVGEVHLKMVLQPLLEGAAKSPSVDAIAFRQVEPGQPAPELDVIRAVYQLDVNEFQGRKSLQLIIDYLEAA